MSVNVGLPRDVTFGKRRMRTGDPQGADERCGPAPAPRVRGRRAGRSALPRRPRQGRLPLPVRALRVLVGRARPDGPRPRRLRREPHDRGPPRDGRAHRRRLRDRDRARPRHAAAHAVREARREVRVDDASCGRSRPPAGPASTCASSRRDGRGRATRSCASRRTLPGPRSPRSSRAPRARARRSPRAPACATRRPAAARRRPRGCRPGARASTSRESRT